MVARMPRACGVGVARILRDMRNAANKYHALGQSHIDEVEKMFIP